MRAVGTWGDDDNIYIADAQWTLRRLPGAGGDPEILLESEAGTNVRRPVALPGSDALLVEILSVEGSRIAVITLADLAVREIVSDGTDPRYSPTGHIVYGRGDALFAVGFDPVRLEVTSPPTPIIQDVRVQGNGMVPASIAADGTLTHIPGSLGSGAEQQWALVWVDRNGREELVSERRGAFRAARLSPDGRRVAFEVFDGSSGIWILGIEDDSFAPLNNEGTSAGPLWTPDSQKVLFNWDDIQSGAVGTPLGGIYSRDASFGSEREEILKTDGGTYPISWSGNGEDLVLHEMIEGQQRRRILVVPFVGEDKTAYSPLDPSGQFNQRSPMVSPDGRWVAYMSTQSGRDEVYVRPFPDGGTRVQISNNGGVEPTWGTDSSELFYREMAGGFTSRMFSAQLAADPELRVTGRTELFSGTYYYMTNWARTAYDYDRANDRFLMVDWTGEIDDPSNSLNITVILDWFDQLRRQVPGGR